MLREKKHKDEQKDDVKKKKTEEGKKDGGGKAPTKRIAEPSDDSDIESTYNWDWFFPYIVWKKYFLYNTTVIFVHYHAI